MGVLASGALRPGARLPLGNGSGSGWDFMSYHPGLPEFLVRVEPDEKYQKALDAHVPAFIEELLAGRERLKGMGVNDGLS